MSTMTVKTAELEEVTGDQDQAAALAVQAVEATESADLGGAFGTLYNTHGPISGPSNDAIIEKTKVREDAGRTIELACLSLAAALSTAAAWYTETNLVSEEILDEQLQS